MLLHVWQPIEHRIRPALAPNVQDRSCVIWYHACRLHTPGAGPAQARLMATTAVPGPNFGMARKNLYLLCSSLSNRATGIPSIGNWEPLPVQSSLNHADSMN
jgi:hypothetical protein